VASKGRITALNQVFERKTFPRERLFFVSLLAVEEIAEFFSVGAGLFIVGGDGIEYDELIFNAKI